MLCKGRSSVWRVGHLAAAPARLLGIQARPGLTVQEPGKLQLAPKSGHCGEMTHLEPQCPTDLGQT